MKTLISRRSFLKAAGVLGAAAACLPVVAAIVLLLPVHLQMVQ